MKSKKALILLILILFIQSGVFGQTIDNKQFPFSIKWKQIETEYCILIFPENLEEKAKEIALTLDSFFPADEASLHTRVDKWPVIINNTLVYVNGYVLGAPEHSQLYTIPPQEGFNGTADWIPFLWSHELRHIVQNEKMIRGFTAFATWLAGEYGSSGMSHFALPNWVWEGDAVLTETLLTSGGRGRIAGFERSMRTNILNDINYDYQKSSLGYYASYKSSIPSWYVMGYHLCTHIRRVYGMEAFNRIMELSADYSFMPLVLNIAVKQVTHKSISEVYKDCLNELKPLWKQQLEGRSFTDTKIIKSAENGDYINYFPLGKLEGKLAALKTSTAAIYSLVTIDDNGKEKLLRKINPIDTNISFNGSIFCWAESRKDIRWGNMSSSVIRTYNPSNNKYRLITEKTRYLSPSISPDGSRIAAIEITSKLDSYIVVLDAADGRLLSRIPEPAGASPSQTCWTEDGTGIVYVRQFDWLKSLRLLNPETKQNIGLTEPAGWDIGAPEVGGDFVYFVSEETGLENIHRVNLDGSKDSRLVISRMYAAASPASDGNILYFSDYSTSGFAAAAVVLENLTELDLNGSHVDYFSGLESQEPFAGCAGPGINTAEITNTSSSYENYNVENYNTAAGLWNFHSRILGTSSSGTGLTIGFQADGIMNNTSSKLYTGYDPSEQEFLTGISGVWAGFYPALLYGAELQSPEQRFGEIIESSVYGGAWLPLDFSSGIWNHSLSMQGVFIMEKLHPAVILRVNCISGSA